MLKSPMDENMKSEKIQFGIKLQFSHSLFM